VYLRFCSLICVPDPCFFSQNKGMECIGSGKKRRTASFRKSSLFAQYFPKLFIFLFQKNADEYEADEVDDTATSSEDVEDDDEDEDDYDNEKGSQGCAAGALRTRTIQVPVNLAIICSMFSHKFRLCLKGN